MDGLILARFRGGLDDALARGIRFCPQLMWAFLDTAYQDCKHALLDRTFLDCGPHSDIQALQLMPGHRVLVLADPDRRADLLAALAAWNPDAHSICGPLGGAPRRPLSLPTLLA